MKLFKIIFPILVLIILHSCGEAKKYNGDSYVNYPDIKMILKENLEPFKTGVQKWKITTNADGKTSSVVKNAEDINWEEWEKPFTQSDFNSQAMDTKYKIDVFNDTLTGMNTILYTALDLSVPTSTLSITNHGMGQHIETLYLENKDAGFFNSHEYKLLYSYGRMIQIQESSKKPFSKLKHKISTLTLMLDSSIQNQ